MNKDLVAVFEYLEREKGINRDSVVKAIEEALVIAARKSITGAANVTVTINPKTGEINVFCEKEIVDEVEVPAQEISLADAREIDPEAELGQFIDVIVTPKEFGRIAAQKAKQIILQKLRGAERDVIYEEYRDRIGELVSGTVKRFVRGANLIVDLGKVEAIMPMKHYPKTEKYHVGDKVLALLFEVNDTDAGGAEVVLSRSHPDFVRQLLDQEIPELGDGTVIIEKIVREAGYRTKIAVRSIDMKVDPVGACVGMRGTRVKNVIRELHNEKIDIIPFAKDPVELLQNSLSPVEIRKVNLSDEEGVISIVVDDEDYPTVIGKKGMNARLTGQLLGYTFEVQRLNDYNRGMAVRRLELADSEDPTLNDKVTEIEGINPMIVDHLTTVNEGKYSTIKALLLATPEELAKIPGISLEMADMILEKIRLQRM